jgi:chromosome segregation ATPase
METVNLRFTAIEERVDAEVASVRQDLAELRLFVTHGQERMLSSLSLLTRTIENGFNARLAHDVSVDQRMDRLEERMDRLEQRMERLEQRMDLLETKLDTHLENALAMLRDIQGRLPPRM